MGRTFDRGGNVRKKNNRLLILPFCIFLIHNNSVYSASIPTGESGIFSLPSAETVGENRVVLGLWSRYQATGPRSDLAPSPFSLELGLGRRLEGGIVLQKLSEVDPLSQYENTGLRVNGKYRFLDERPRIPAAALLVSIDHLTSNPDYGMQIILTKTFLPLQTSLALGYSQGKDSQDNKTEVIVGGAGIILPIMKNLDILGELKTISPNSTSRLTSLVPGVRYSLSPTVNLALGLEVGIGPEDILWSLTAGLALSGSSVSSTIGETAPVSVRYRKEKEEESVEGDTEVQDRELEYKTPTPTFRLRIPMLRAPAEEAPSEPPEDQDEPTQ